MPDDKLLTELAGAADLTCGGHFTVMKFTTNWRVGFGTPGSRCDIDQMWEGKTFADAARAALAACRNGSFVSPRCQTHEMSSRGGLRGAYVIAS